MDLATKEHWNSIYDKCQLQNEISDISISGYLNKLIEGMLISYIEKYKPKSILEIGCGNSIWLPYIEQKFNIKVYGIDYSERGCELVKAKLKENRDNIFCVDFFNAESIKRIPKVNFVFSLGVVEHFSSLEEVLKIFQCFLCDHGILLTEVPNLNGMNGIISKLYQPSVFKKHIVHTLDTLDTAYQQTGLHIIEKKYIGCFSPDLVAWGVSPRIKGLDKIIQLIYKSFLTITTPLFQNDTINSPFLTIIGQKEY